MQEVELGAATVHHRRVVTEATPPCEATPGFSQQNARNMRSREYAVFICSVDSHWESNLPPRGTFLCPGGHLFMPRGYLFMPRGYCLATPGHLFVPWGQLFVLLLN